VYARENRKAYGLSTDELVRQRFILAADLPAMLQRGTHNITVEYLGDGNYLPASTPLTLTVVPNQSVAIEARGPEVGG